GLGNFALINLALSKVGSFLLKTEEKKATYKNLLRNSSVPSAPPPCLLGRIEPTFYFLLLPWLFSPQNPLSLLKTFVLFVVKNLCNRAIIISSRRVLNNRSFLNL